MHRVYAIISINRFRFIRCFAVSLFGIDYLLIPTLVELHFKSIGGKWNTISVRLSVWICYEFVWIGSNSVGSNSVWLGLASYNLAVAPYKFTLTPYKFTLNPYDSAPTPYDLTPTLQNKCVSNLQFISKMLILIDVGFKLMSFSNWNSQHIEIQAHRNDLEQRGDMEICGIATKSITQNRLLF